MLIVSYEKMPNINEFMDSIMTHMSHDKFIMHCGGCDTFVILNVSIREFLVPEKGMRSMTIKMFINGHSVELYRAYRAQWGPFVECYINNRYVGDKMPWDMVKN